jgi:hypothetical protein
MGVRAHADGGAPHATDGGSIRRCPMTILTIIVCTSLVAGVVGVVLAVFWPREEPTPHAAPPTVDRGWRADEKPTPHPTVDRGWRAFS